MKKRKHKRRHYSLPRFPRWVWVLGSAVALFYHAYGILSGIYSGLSILSYDSAMLLGLFEVLLGIGLAGYGLARLVVWWHDRPREMNWYSDQGLIR